MLTVIPSSFRGGEKKRPITFVCEICRKKCQGYVQRPLVWTLPPMPFIQCWFIFRMMSFVAYCKIMNHRKYLYSVYLVRQKNGQINFRRVLSRPGRNKSTFCIFRTEKREWSLFQLLICTTFKWTFEKWFAWLKKINFGCELLNWDFCGMKCCI